MPLNHIGFSGIFHLYVVLLMLLNEDAPVFKDFVDKGA
jgi:hypothetical protein